MKVYLTAFNHQLEGIISVPENIGDVIKLRLSRPIEMKSGKEIERIPEMKIGIFRYKGTSVIIQRKDYPVYELTDIY